MGDVSGEYHDMAVAAFDRGDLRESIGWYRAALREDPGDACLHYNLALALGGVGDVRAAGAEFHEAVRLDGTDARLHYGLACHLAKARQWDRALAAFRRAEACRPGWPAALSGAVYALASKARRSGRAEDFRAFLTALDRLPAGAVDPAYRQERRVWAQWHLGQRTGAVALLEDLVRREPTTARFSLLFRYQRRRGHWRAAARTLRAWFRFEFEAIRRGQEWDERARRERR